MNRAADYQAKSFVLRAAGMEIWKVNIWQGGRLCVCTPDFNSKGAADAYADMINRGQRAPELRK